MMGDKKMLMCGLSEAILEYLTTFTERETCYPSASAPLCIVEGDNGHGEWGVLIHEREEGLNLSLLMSGWQGTNMSFSTDDPMSPAEAMRWLRCHLRDYWFGR